MELHATRQHHIRVAFVLTELTVGGAELMLWKLLSRMDRSRFQPCVFALSRRTDRMLELFQTIGVPCHVLGMKGSLHGLARLPRLAKALREARPDILQGWLYHGNIAATLAALLAGLRAPVLWNIRGTLIAGEKKLSAFVIWLCGKLSFLPEKIINNSMKSALEHEQRLGYRAEKRIVLPNGFDTALFRPSQEARATVRRMLALSDDSILIGLVGRYHKMKDHGTFLRAAAELRVRHEDAHYLLAGQNVDPKNVELTRLIVAHGLSDRVHLLGARSDMDTITASLDVATSSSASGEGFPNVIGEAMSCGVPCVVTDVGDSAWIVGDTGRVVPPRDPQALARSLAGLLELDKEQRRTMGARARDRIIEHFSLDTVVRQYEDLYMQVHERFRQEKRA